MSNTSKVILVTGGSSGIGQAAAVALAGQNHVVYELSRRESSQPGIIHITADVTNEESVKAAVNQIIQQENHIDIVINSAGFGIAGAIEFTKLEDAKKQFDVNFFGMVNVNKAAIPLMRNQGYGRIINISSVAAVAHLPFQAYYSATKAAIESYSSALANEIKPFGISVTSIQPGDIKTGFTSARNKSYTGDDIYNGRICRSVSKMEKDEQNGMSASQAGKFIAKIALKKKVKPVYVIGLVYNFLCLLIKLLPNSIRNRIVGIMYAK